jgi:hypothetical protein
MKNMDALFILCWRITTNQFSFLLFFNPPIWLNMRCWRFVLHFFIKYFIPFCFYFLNFLTTSTWIWVWNPPPIHSPTHPLSQKKKKKRVKSIVQHGTSKSNAYLLLLLALHVCCLLVAMLVRRFVIAAHDRQIAPPSRPCQVTYL